MKEEFYCLPLKKKVKAKITTVVKKKSYALKGVHKVGDKSYNLNKTCSKVRAEEVAAALGIEIEHTAAAETVVPEGSFLPEGSGNVIGQNTAGTETAIEATESTPTANTTPFHSDSEDKIGPMSMAAEVSVGDNCPTCKKEIEEVAICSSCNTRCCMPCRDSGDWSYDEKLVSNDNSGDICGSCITKSMAAEEPPTGSDMIDAFAGPAIEKMIEEDDSDYEVDDYLLLIDGKIREVSGNTEMDVLEKEKPDSYHIIKITGVEPYKIQTVDFNAEDYKKSRSSSDEEVLEGAMEDELAEDVPEGFSPSDDKTVQFEDGTLMSPTKEAETGGVSYAIEPDHWLRLQAHRDWQGTREEVNVERENNFWVITGSQESADDILDLIIETADTELTDMTPVTSTGISKGVTLGIGVLGIAASIILLQRFNKSD